MEKIDNVIPFYVIEVHYIPRYRGSWDYSTSIEASWGIHSKFSSSLQWIGFVVAS